MTGLQQLDIKTEYRTLTDDILGDLLIPALKVACLYQRAVGYFSSSALVDLSYGLGPLVTNGGKIQLMASPHLSNEDIDAIDRGYKELGEVMRDAVVRSLEDPTSDDEAARLNLLANLVASNVLNIKIAFANKHNKLGLFHEKLGVITDAQGNAIAFSGSMNESEAAHLSNYEAVDVFKSWNDPEGRFHQKRDAFEAMWSNVAEGMLAYDFPELGAEIVRRYKTGVPNTHLDKRIIGVEYIGDGKKPSTNKNNPKLPSWLELRKYQKDARDACAAQNYRGIFDMATGTGKTYTGLATVTQLSEQLGHHLALIILCPFQHLVEQWAPDIEAFNMRPIIAFSSSPQKDWERMLKQAIRDQNYGVSGAEFFCLVTTNATFCLDRVQKLINRIRGPICLMADEAHNLGAEDMRKFLDDRFNYRIALSATIERFGDPVGTKFLYSYFGEKCITYTTEEAIYGGHGEEPHLCEYNYHPVIVTLSGDELLQYKDYTREIAKCVIVKDGQKRLSERGKAIAMKRARLVAGAQSKIPTLLNQIEPYQNDNYMLVYCGTATIRDEKGTDTQEKRQIEAVTNLLGNKLGMSVHTFTSRETSKEREQLIDLFTDGRYLQCLVAIKCLDEGVDIPNIKTAFILASTTNPREFIQRRGRLLRKAEGKDFAEIYDFICLPRQPENTFSLTDDEMAGEKSLVRKELTRAYEFARIARNSAVANHQLAEIEDAFFGLDGMNEAEEDETW